MGNNKIYQLNSGQFIKVSLFFMQGPLGKPRDAAQDSGVAAEHPDGQLIVEQ
jgi:hypothetical protein